MEKCIREHDRGANNALDEDHRDRDAESRYSDRQETAQRIIDSIGGNWYGWEFWHVATEFKLSPADMSATWAMDDIYQAYFYLRIKYLREAPGGA